MSKTKDHPFYCDKKRCRKSAWETPDYLSESDWNLVDQVVEALTTRDRATFDALMDGPAALAFFNRVIGWPEGLNYYCGGSDVARENYFRGFCSDADFSELTQLRQAIAARMVFSA